VYAALDNALDCGIAESDFWGMTLAEINRQISSRNRVMRIRAQEKASFDYIQANLIIKGISRILGDKGEYPTIIEAYPKLFDDVAEQQQAKIQKQKDDLSALRFKQYANFHNKKYKEVANDK
jgi:hypothetical protein